MSMLRPTTMRHRSRTTTLSKGGAPYLDRLRAQQRKPASGSRKLTTAKESFDLLEAFFIGRALAETINERLGTLAADTFAEISKLEAEIRRSISEFENEVVERGRREMMSTIIPDGTGPSTSMSSGGVQVENEEFVPADLGEAVDNLRAEIAATRALVQQIKPKFTAQP